MKKSLTVRPEVEADVDEAYLWYEDKASGLGAHFLLSVDAVMASIERNPQISTPSFTGTSSDVLS